MTKTKNKNKQAGYKTAPKQSIIELLISSRTAERIICGTLMPVSGGLILPFISVERERLPPDSFLCNCFRFPFK